MMNDIVDGKLDCLGVASPPSRPNRLFSELVRNVPGYILAFTLYSVSKWNIALWHTAHARDQPGREGLTTRLLLKKC